MEIVAVRGAITIDENTKEDILKNTEELLRQIIEKNNIKFEDIISVLFSATEDIDAAYPAVAARNLGINSAALLCFQEMKVVDSLEMCIRVMIQIQTQNPKDKIQHVYLKGAVKLRPDLCQ